MIDQFTKTGREIEIYVRDQKMKINRAEFEEWFEEEDDNPGFSWSEFWNGEPEDVHAALESYLIFKYGDSIFDEIFRGNALLSDFDE